MSEAEAFERAIIENPDDIASYSAYADWLQERDDPRGEFIAVQLALEDESRSKEARGALKAREAELLAAHEREWLGPLAAHVYPDSAEDMAKPDYDWSRPRKPTIDHRWRRGMLADLTLECITVPLAHALADAPVVRTVRQWHVVSTAYYLGMQDDTTPRRVAPPPEYRGYDEWLELLGSPLLHGVRVFRMGDIDGDPGDGWGHNHTYTPGIERLIAEMPHIEELHLLCKEYDPASLFALQNLTNLRVLRMYALGEPYGDAAKYEIPLDVLATNPALSNLTHLSVHPHFAFDRSFVPLPRVTPLLRSPHLKSLTHLQIRLSDMGDDGVREVIASGILKRLKVLDLQHGEISDAGAQLLARCPDAKKLERIDLSYNGVTSAGLAVLRKEKVNAVANNPLTQTQLDEREYLRHGDFE